MTIGHCHCLAAFWPYTTGSGCSWQKAFETSASRLATLPGQHHQIQHIPVPCLLLNQRPGKLQTPLKNTCATASRTLQNSGMKSLIMAVAGCGI